MGSFVSASLSSNSLYSSSCCRHVCAWVILSGFLEEPWVHGLSSRSIASVYMLSLQSSLTLFDPMDCSPPGSSVHGILQARILEWVAMPSSRGSSQPRNQNFVSCDSCIAGGFFTTEPPGKPVSSVQLSCSVMSDSLQPWTAPSQASLSVTSSRSLLKLMSIESVMPSNHLILCHPLLLLPSIFPSIRDFSNE